MERGLRQGDPLAPFLFLVVAECLHLMVEKAENSGLLKGVKVGKNNVSISHLQYADDVILFGAWETEYLKNMMKLMECFYSVSGLKINLNKSKLYGIGVNDEVKKWAVTLGCGYGKLPLLYLGLPVGTSMHFCSNWLPVIEKSKKKLAGRKAKLFSFGGRWTLTKTILGSLSLYYFSLFRAPVRVVNTLERLRSNFFWGGVGGLRESENCSRGFHWVKWPKVIGSFESGGLNVGSLKDINWGLLCKWWWQFHVEDGALWVKVIKSIFGEDGGLASLGRSRGKGNNSVWGNIMKVGLEVDKLGINFSNSFWKSIGDGADSKFWEDSWVEVGRLKDKFMRLFKLEENKSISIADRGSFEGDSWIWKWGWRRELGGREIGEFEGLMKALEGFLLKKNVKDRVTWKFVPIGGFTVKELRKILDEAVRRGGGVNSNPTMWLKEIPKKVCIFMWRVGLGRIPVRMELDRRGIDLDSILCPRCEMRVNRWSMPF
ncbi:hypothetical protein OSB04_012416 [Centaurea solstitialis]|uniref:Reverse transcriptase domain-containing protein n=1 Tax=Centaurea solstitialis TaxID=347529 RepID=A0AA38TUD9_9ASTR|nr:hypothetical protein OSB04_012416 [Centaurea solstitialis]